jgi:hypothetical protein
VGNKPEGLIRQGRRRRRRKMKTKEEEENECWDKQYIRTKKSSIFWDITPRSPVKFNRHFGGKYRFHHQGRRISEASNQRGAGREHS